jgi:plastocyanin
MRIVGIRVATFTAAFTPARWTINGGGTIKFNAEKQCKHTVGIAATTQNGAWLQIRRGSSISGRVHGNSNEVGEAEDGRNNM